MKPSRLAAIVAVLACASLAACDSDSLVAFFHYSGITVLYVGDDVVYPPPPPNGPGGGGGPGGGPGGIPAAPGAGANAAPAGTLATFANDRYRVWKFEEVAGGEIFFKVAEREGQVIHERIREEDFRVSMPDLFRDMERSLALGL
jgi:hypothetical protein